MHCAFSPTAKPKALAGELTVFKSELTWQMVGKLLARKYIVGGWPGGWLPMPQVIAFSLVSRFSSVLATCIASKAVSASVC